MTKSQDRRLTSEQTEKLLETLEERFEMNTDRHPDINWSDVHSRLLASEIKLWSLQQMEHSGGEPDVIQLDDSSDRYYFFDCAAESPVGRRSMCYDLAGLESRKKYVPDHNAIDYAEDMGIEMITEEEYYYLQRLGDFDTKTSSWLHTPDNVREKGGAIFGDFRYGRTFIYHNGAQSYYGSRGFRGKLEV